MDSNFDSTVESNLDSSDGIDFAPGEGQTPISIMYDEDCEELSFVSIFGGVSRKHNPNVKISLAEQIDSELRRRDRRCCRPDHLLFVHKRLQCKQLFGNINIALKKTALQNCKRSQWTAGDVLANTIVMESVASDHAFRFMSAMPGSPAYWENQKKNVMAMVRQYGIFTFFITLTSAESHYVELLNILKITVDKEHDADVTDLDWTEKVRLISSDPMTCAQYFDHKFHEVMKTWKNVKNGPFGKRKVLHRYYRIEFQHRGSHVYMFTQLIFAKNISNVLLFGIEYYECGDLFHYQQENGGLFGEDVVRFFVAEILVAVNTLHQMRIIHRDIKRENILINSRGHVVVGDFGFAKYLEKDQLSFTNIGTVGYVIFDNFYY